MRRFLLTGLLLLASAAAHAQSPTAPAKAPGVKLPPGVVLPKEIPFYLQRGYFNRNGTLTLDTNDIVRGNPMKFPKVSVFIYADLAHPDSAKFFARQYPKLKAEADANRAILVLRDRAESPSSLTLYRLAWCMPNEYSFDFVEKALQQQAKWAKAPTPRQFFEPIYRTYGMQRADYDSCLADDATQKRVTAHAEKARELRVLRTNPIELYVNSYYFPGLVDEAFFTNALEKSVRKIKRDMRIDPVAAQKVLTLRDDDRVFGARTAPVQLYIYETPESMTSGPFLRDILPLMRRDYIDAGKLAVIFRPYPWFRTGDEVQALLECVPGDAYWSVYQTVALQNPTWLNPKGDWLYTPEALPKVRNILRSARVDLAKVDACAASDATKKRITTLRDDANATFDMFFTPTYYLGGDEILGGIVYDAWKAKIDAKIEQAQQAAERAARMKQVKADIEARFSAFTTSMTAPAAVAASPTAVSPTKP
jgi:protein-disulfide isomerase